MLLHFYNVALLKWHFRDYIENNVYKRLGALGPSI